MWPSRTLSSIALLLFSILPALCFAAQAKDRSGEFASWYSQENKASQIENLSPQLEEKLHKYFFLIVPGVLSDYMDFTIGAFHLETENKFMNFLAAHGLEEGKDFEKLNLLQNGYSGEAAPAANTEAIAAAIRSATKPVLLITHSKGSVDSLVTLVEHPELRKKIAGWVASQSPFWGSPTADQICAHPVEGLAAEIPFEFFGGSQAGLQNLREDVRTEFMNSNRQEIAKITKQIPTLSFASYLQHSDLKGWMGFINKLYGQKMELFFHNQHDGLVPVASAMLPGADFVIFEGLSHLSDNRPEKPYTALAVMLLERL